MRKNTKIHKKNIKVLAKTAVALSAFTMTATLAVINRENSNADTIRDDKNATSLPGSFKGFTFNKDVPSMPVYGIVKSEPLFMSDMKTTGSHYKAWCVNYDRYSPDSGSSTTKKKAVSNYMFHALRAGYPMKSVSKLGANSQTEAIAATQIAVWIAAGNFKLSDVNWNNYYLPGKFYYSANKTTQTERNHAKKLVTKILEDAKKDKTSQSTPKGTIVKSGSERDTGDAKEQDYKVGLTGSHKFYGTSAKISDLKVTGDATLLQNGKQLSKGSSFNPTQKVTISSKNGGDLSFSTSGTIDTFFKAGQYNTQNNGKPTQNVSIMSNVDADYYPIKTTTTTASKGKPKGSIELTKQGSEGDPMENIKFDLLDKDKKVIKSGVTDDGGSLEFEDLEAGTYFVREADTDTEHKVNHALHDSSFTDDDIENSNTPSLDITNDVIDDNPYIKTAATEQDTGSRYIDAKNTKLQDEIQIDNLDGSHQYKLVDTMKDPKTGETAMIDGKPVTKEVQFTADGESGSHSSHKETLKFDDAQFKGLQGKKYSFESKLYTVSDNPSLNNKLVAQEFSLNDTNQTITVRKPVIKTKLRSAIQQDSTTDTQKVNPYTKTKLIDNVDIQYLVKDHEYTTHLKMMIKQKDGSVKPLVVNGKEITATKDFSADNDHMNIDVPFDEFDTTNLNGKDLVVYSNVTPKDETDNQLATHNDADDKDETAHVTDPQIQSNAFIDDDSQSNPNHNSRLKDRVAYSDVAQNQPMTLAAVAADDNGNATVIKSKATDYQGHAINGTGADSNKEIKTANYYLEGKVNITPASDEGTVDVPLQKVATGVTNLTENPKDDQTDVSSPSKRYDLNKLNPVDPDDVNIDPTKAAQTSTNNAYYEELAGKLGFTPKNDSTVYDIDTTSIAGQKLHMYEDLYVDGDKSPVVHESNNANEDQTVEIKKIKIVTEAYLNDHKVSNPSKKSRLYDKVRIENAAPGHKLQISSLVVNQKDGKNIEITDHDKIYNLMGKLEYIPETTNSSVKVPLQMVTKSDGISKNDNNGNPNILNPDNVLSLQIENVKDDRTVQNLNVAVNSLQSDGSDNKNDVIKEVQNSYDTLKDLVYNSKIGMPDDTIKYSQKLINTIGNGKDYDLTDLKDSANYLLKNINDEVRNGVLVTNDQYETVKAKAQDMKDNPDKYKSETTSTSVENSDAESEESSQTRVKNNLIETKDPQQDSDEEQISDNRFAIDTTQLRGQTLSLYEDVTNPYDNNDTTIVSEANVKNSDQSTRVTNPSAQTMQTVNDKKQVYSDVKLANIVDKVQFKDFAPNEQVTLTAVEMDKGTKEAAKLEGNYLVGRQTFTPKTLDGTVKVYMAPQQEQPEMMYMVKLLNSNGLPTSNMNNTQEASSNKTADQALGMNGTNENDSQNNTSSNSNGQTDAGHSNTVETNQNGDNSYESGANNTVGTDNVNSHTDTTQNSLDLNSLTKLADNNDNPTPSRWTAFETAQTNDGSVITEHKDISSDDQTVTIQIPKSSNTSTDGKGNIVINNQNGQQQGNNNKNGDNSNSSNSNGGSASSNSNGGSNSNSSNNGGATGGSSNGTINGSNSGTPSNGQSSGSQLGGGSYYSPKLAQTGSSEKVSHSWLYEKIYSLFK